MKKSIYILTVVVLIFACKKANLNQLAFPSEKLDSYEFSEFDGPELEVPDSYYPTEQYLVSFPSYSIENNEEYEIYGLYMGDTANIDTDTIIYYLHGQSRHMDYYWTRQALISALGNSNYGVFMIDYRGYGMSEGSSTEIGLSEDTDAGLDWLIDRGAVQERTFMYGFSLGAIPAIERTAYRDDFTPAKLIVESPLASVAYLTQSSTLIKTDDDFVTTLKFENAENIKDVNVPFMWMHGKEDDYIEINNGEIIYNNYQGPYSEAWRIDTAMHGNVPAAMGLENYLKAVTDFVRY